MHKRMIYIWIIVCAVLSLSAVWIIWFLFVPHKSIERIDSPSDISCVGYHPGNNRQQESNVWLGCYNGQLYYFGGNKSGVDKTKYDSYLCVFREGSLEKVARLSHGYNRTISILGIVDRFIYYREHVQKNYNEQYLYCFDLENHEKTLLFTGELKRRSSLYFADDGTVYFPLWSAHGEKSQFVHVSGQNILDVKPLAEGYPLGDSIYYVVSEDIDVQVERVLETDLFGNVTCEEIPFEQAHRRSVIPYDTGLLVHNQELSSLLYRIDDAGVVTELFNIPCLGSESAVNIHKTDAYISVLRYEKYGEKGMLRYENDTLEGTYRINLTDGSIEKMNDMCFDGIYNFDDSCFYCCDKRGNIYRMEFDGNLSPVLLISQ